MDRYVYFVEGENEEKVVNTLKDIKNQYIVAGKSHVFNLTQNKISDAILMTLTRSTIAVIIYDNDVIISGKTNSEITKKRINENIKLLKNNCKEVIVICQYDNIEDEIIKATNIKKIEELLNSKSKAEAKTDLNKERNLMKKLSDKNFDFNKFWRGAVPDYIIQKVEGHQKIRLNSSRQKKERA